ncbi:MAG TPA: DNA-protecting protein DprA [Lentisphaeria bacterium]|nr:MAG: DNA protecting protein DprA [Lentisphaerae bacterium GWF2_38_69]HBM15882.1 DNA-protecting protein DprA [Lentisphaeria bacterium]
MTEREAIIALNMLNGFGSSRYKSLLAAFGSIESALAASTKSLSTVEGIGDTLAQNLSNWKNSIDLNRELEMLNRSGATITTLIDENYPSQLKEIKDMPLCLYIRGELNADFNNTIAVVGSRKMTSYGREVCDFIVSGLSCAGWTIVSGLAMGIDGSAHQAVLDAKGATIGVLGGGLARFHPQEHVELARKMIESGGGVITEFPMEFSPNRRSFPMRNRIISGLSRGVLVIEAGIQSGALITVDFALEQNRQVFAIPGRINNPSSQGCNKLIKNGAKLVENIDDIFEEFEFLPGFVPFDKNQKTDSSSEKDFRNLSLSQNEVKILESLKLEEKRVDVIAAETALPIGCLLAVLQQMESRKIIKQLPGKLYKLF